LPKKKLIKRANPALIIFVTPLANNMTYEELVKKHTGSSEEGLRLPGNFLSR
jgi:hypothetical protein